MGAAPGGEAGGEPPLAEQKLNSRKENILSMLNEDTSLSDLFDTEKAQKNIYEIEKAIIEITKEENDN
jgi:hypothetical protein